MYVICVRVSMRQFFSILVTTQQANRTSSDEFFIAVKRADDDKILNPVCFLLQNLKDQILTTNVWLEHVS